MSSLRYAVQKRQHKERAQPIERGKYGLLEKHKDYALRAKDFKEKKRRLKTLKEKAADRNPDEFHFGMMSSRMKDGRKIISRGNAALDMETARLLKTQDAGYIRTILQKTRLERERMEQEVQIVEEDGEEALRFVDQKQGSMGRHTVFVDDVDEQKAFDAADWFGTDDKGLEKTYNRPRRTSETFTAAADTTSKPPMKKTARQLEDEERAKVRQERDKERRARKQRARRNLLSALRQRENTLAEAAEELEAQRNRMNNNPGSVTRSGKRIMGLSRKRKR